MNYNNISEVKKLIREIENCNRLLRSIDNSNYSLMMYMYEGGFESFSMFKDIEDVLRNQAKKLVKEKLDDFKRQLELL
jgi:hypothetical protein